MNELKVYKLKINEILKLIYPLLFIILIVFYLIAYPLNVHAEESLKTYYCTYQRVSSSGTQILKASFEKQSKVEYVYILYDSTYILGYLNTDNTISTFTETISGEIYDSNGNFISNTDTTTNLGDSSGTWTWNTNIKMFNTTQAALNYLLNGDTSGEVNKPIDIESATYNSNIPIPKLVFNSQGGYKFSIDNAIDSYYIQIKGRWYTVDDITLYKENLQWKYKYDTLLKGSLTDWVEPNEKILATAEHDLCDMNRKGYGAEAFTALIARYGIEQRNYSGGTNALGNKLSGYSDALSTLKELHLKNPLSAFNSPEIYIRFIVVNDDNSVNYGKWCHWYSNLANSSGSSGSNLDDSDNVSGESQSYNGLTDDELNNNEQQENPRNDSDIYTYVNSDYIKQNIEISSDIANKTGAFFELLNSMFNAMGQFPQMFKDVFMFLPPWFINFIIISMGAIIIVRFIGR